MGRGLNRYEYCRNNPAVYRDPIGHDVVNDENLYKNYRITEMNDPYQELK